MADWKRAILTAALIATGSSDAGAQSDDLAAMVAKLGAAGRSVLEATLTQSDAEMITNEGSANDVVWSAFTSRGWMTAQPAPDGGPAGIKLKVYAMTDEGRKQIAALLERTGKP